MEIVLTLLMLILLQAVLGFDNLLYISLESKRAPEKDQSRVRKWGIGIAVGLRIVLLFLLVKMIEFFQAPWASPNWEGVFVGKFTSNIDRLAADQTFGRVHGDGADGVFAQVLRDFQHQLLAVVVCRQRVQNCGQVVVELHVNDGADHLRDFTSGLCHVITL